MIDFKPWLLLPAKASHDLSPIFIRFCGWLRSQKQQNTLDIWQPFEWRGLHFRNRLGTSGGLDKNAEQVSGWWALGAGFIEVGTVTPQPQEANPSPILDRNLKQKALWNKMGFPNKGLKHVLQQLHQHPKPHVTPIFVNVGKNRTTSNENAVHDYLECIRVLKNEADAFVVNVSSPNTKGLRELLAPGKLHNLIAPLVEECRKGETRNASGHNQASNTKPLLLKLSPDMSNTEFTAAIDASLEAGIDGWILTNTTTAREKTPQFSAEGGVSGAPLAPRSKELLSLAVSHLGDRKKDRLLISVGGVLSPQDVFDRLSLGADLVQVYSALVFNGPFFFKNVSQLANKT